MKRAVLYMRYSSDNQTEQSIEGQRRECEEFAEKNDIQILAEYIDRATSGTQTDTRYEFLRMVDESKTLEYDYVLVYKLDRFARNRYDSAIYKRKLRNNGKKVLSAKENITDSPEGIILEGMLEAYNEYFSAELSQKVRRGMRESFLKGKAVGTLPLGYTTNKEKTIVIDDEQAEIVKSVFDIYLKSPGLTTACNTLNNLGYKTRRGSKFTPTSIKNIIKNRFYIGEYVMKRSDEIGKVPRIIDNSTWNKAHDKMQRASKRTRDNCHDYEFTGYIKCGCCGGNYSGSLGGSYKTRSYFFYRCRRCDKFISELKLKSILQETISEYLSDSCIERIADKCMLEYERQKGSSENEICKQLKRNLSETNKQINNIINSIAVGIDANIVKEKLDDLQVQKQELEKRILMATVSNTSELNRDIIIAFLSKVKNSEQIIKLMLNCMVIYKDKMIICLNLTDESNMPPLEQIEVCLNCDRGYLIIFYTNKPLLLLVKDRPW